MEVKCASFLAVEYPWRDDFGTLPWPRAEEIRSLLIAAGNE
jgi:hypothetical protein